MCVLFLTVALLCAVGGAAPAAPDPALEAARAGDVDAMLRVAFEFRDGAGGREKTHREAFAWFSKAAAAGHPRALDNAGWLLEHGLGTPRDVVRARELYRRSADLGNPEAQSNLARCLLDGMGGPKDAEAALGWALKAFRSGDDDRGAGILMDALVARTNLVIHRELLEQIGRSRSQHAMLRLGHVFHEGLGGLAMDEDLSGVYYERARQYGMKGEVLDPKQVAALAARRNERGAFAYLPVAHLEQGYNMCAPTAAAMALGYYLGAPPDPYAIKTNCASAGTRPGT